MSDPIPTCPAPLRRELLRAARLSCELARLVERVDQDDRSFVWLVGRADEVRAFVGSTMGEWRAERLDAGPAAERVHTYVEAVESSLVELFGPRAAPSEESTLPFRPQSDTLADP
jgi:hypothetical protein